MPALDIISTYYTIVGLSYIGVAFASILLFGTMLATDSDGPRDLARKTARLFKR